MKTFLTFLLFFLVECWVWIIPETLLVKVGRGIGLLCYFLKLRKSVVRKNLEIAFGEVMEAPQREQLCKEIYLNLGNVLFEILLMSKIQPENLGRYIKIDGLEQINEAFKEGKGIILAGGHFGHWELMTAAISRFVTPVYGYAGMQKNQFFDHKINQIRQKFGTVTISKGKTSVRAMVKALRKNKLVGIIGDLNVPHQHLFVDFFGKRASMGQGLPALTIKYKTPLFFAWNTRVGPLQHHARIIRLDYSVTGDEEKDIQMIAQRISSQLEAVVRENPDHYFWVNKRWKTRPTGETTPPPYY